MSDEKLVFNGLATNGAYAFPRLSEEDLARLALGETTGDELLREILEQERKNAEKDFRHDPPQGVELADLSRTGWGVIFPQRSSETRRVMAEYLEYRRDQASLEDEEYYQEIVYPDGESTADFLLDRGATPYETADPSRMPYYLLLVGSPEEIPYSFQYELSLQYAVGRIDFETLEDYERYGESVIRAERHPLRARRAAFFGVENDGDTASAATTDDLVANLADRMEDYRGDWQISRHLAAQASKSDLQGLLSGGKTPALLFAGGHGLVPSDPAQREAYQGALVCSDWPTPGDSTRAIRPEHLFSARDLKEPSIELEGLITFFFGCYSAGTPNRDEFNLGRSEEGQVVGQRPFLSALSKKLLTRGALALIGHVDRTWMSAFRWPGGALQIETFSNALKRLLDGYPVGSALSRFAIRHGQLSGWLRTLEDQQAEEPLGKSERRRYSRLWRGNRDARNFIVVGDPAVRLSVEEA